jgi:phage replication O-like protein O
MPPGRSTAWGFAVPDQPYPFDGFSRPTYTPIPDELFDVLLPDLSKPELKVLLYVMRRTFGFKKDADAISTAQLVSDITTKDGRVLDRGTGLPRSSVKTATQSLVERGILTVRQVRSETGDYDSNVYSVRFKEVVQPLAYPWPASDLPVGQPVDPQETGIQQTAGQHFESSKGPVSFEKYDQARLAILPYAEDLARELGDQAPLSSTTTRLTNLYRDSGLELDTFLDLLIAARGITQERTASIRTPRPEGMGPKPKMAYWFTVLEDLIGQTRSATGTDAGD